LYEYVVLRTYELVLQYEYVLVQTWLVQNLYELVQGLVRGSYKCELVATSYSYKLIRLVRVLPLTTPPAAAGAAAPDGVRGG